MFVCFFTHSQQQHGICGRIHDGNCDDDDDDDDHDEDNDDDDIEY